MGGVDIMNQKMYSLMKFLSYFSVKIFNYLQSYYEHDRKSKIRFYLRLFFDLMDLGVQNSYIIYDKISTNNSYIFNKTFGVSNTLNRWLLQSKSWHHLNTTRVLYTVNNGGSIKFNWPLSNKNGGRNQKAVCCLHKERH